MTNELRVQLRGAGACPITAVCRARPSLRRRYHWHMHICSWGGTSDASRQRLRSRRAALKSAAAAGGRCCTDCGPERRP